MSDAEVVPIVPMTREEAFARARQIFGERGPVVGVNAQYPDAPCFVGRKLSYEGWSLFGAGKTWEEAFANVREVLHQKANKAFVYKDDKK